MCHPFSSSRATVMPGLIPVMVSLALLCPAAESFGAVIFTAGVPNGTTNFPGIVQFGVSNQNNQSPQVQTDIGTGVTGNDIVTGMDADMDNFATSFDGSVSGNTLTYSTATDGYFLAPAEVQMSLQKTDTGSGGVVVHQPHLPYGIDPPQSPGFVLILMLAGADGANVTAGSQGTAEVALLLPAVQMIRETYDENTTTAEINRGLYGALQQADLPDGISPILLTSDTQAYPALFSMNPFEVSMHWTPPPDGQTNFLVGGISASVPEPSATLVVALVLLGFLARRRSATRS